MKKQITILFIFLSSITFAQKNTSNKYQDLFMSQKFVRSITECEQILKDDSTNFHALSILGRSKAALGEYSDATIYLKQAIKLDTLNNWIKAWSLHSLALCQFQLGLYNGAHKNMKACSNMQASRNLTRLAQKHARLLGFDDHYKTWQIHETKNIRFHFQKMSHNKIINFSITRQTAFDQINAFFESKLPRKINFFVWNSKEDAAKSGLKLGFANPMFCIVHVHHSQSRGHELAHIISNHIGRMIKRTGLINEGTAVCFDQNKLDREQIVRGLVTGNNQKVNIKELWNNWTRSAYSYHVAGLFVKNIIEKYGQAKFLTFFTNQTYENALKVFGKDFDEFINEFENCFES